MSSCIPINIVYEDFLSEAIIRKILSDKYILGTCRNGRGNGYIKKTIKGYNKASRRMAYLILTDLDNNVCAPKLIEEWMGDISRHNNLLFRVAVREVESWVLADRAHFAEFLEISETLVPKDVDGVYDPKQCLINLVKKSKKRNLHDDIVPKGDAKQGPNYNNPLISFVMDSWDPHEAICNSPSLKRTIKSIENFQPEYEK